MASSSPVQAAVEAIGWRDMFHVIAAATMAVAVIIFLVVPERRAEGEPKTLADQLRGLGIIFRSRAFWSVAPLVMTAQAAWMSTQALWFGPWLRDMAGARSQMPPPGPSSSGVSAWSRVMPLLGWLAERLGRIGIGVNIVAGVATGLFIGVPGPHRRSRPPCPPG